jgi:4-diphosphocytidyl-2-C-methyl-D-erythritol kinase
VLAAAGQGAGPLSYRELLVNDLGRAALSLRPSIGEALAALEEAGAALALVTGSGPTAVGLFATDVDALRAADELERAGRQAIAVRSGRKR